MEASRRPAKSEDVNADPEFNASCSPGNTMVAKVHKVRRFAGLKLREQQIISHVVVKRTVTVLAIKRGIAAFYSHIYRW